MVVDLGANQFPDARMSGSVGFMSGVWVMFGMMVSPVLGASIPVVVLSSLLGYDLFSSNLAFY